MTDNQVIMRNGTIVRNKKPFQNERGSISNLTGVISINVVFGKFSIQSCQRYSERLCRFGLIPMGGIENSDYMLLFYCGQIGFAERLFIAVYLR